MSATSLIRPAIASLVVSALLSASLSTVFAPPAASVDDPADAASASAAAEGAKDAGESASKGAADLAKDFGSAVGNSIIGWGVGTGLNLLMSAIWPPPNYTQMLADLSQQIANEQASLNEISSSLTNLQTQLGSTQAVAAQGTCATAMANADAQVAVIKEAFENYLDVMDANWLVRNTKPSAGLSNLNVVGNQVFSTSSSSANPSFLPGLNKVAASTQALGQQLVAASDGSTAGGLLNVCADAVAASVSSSLPSAGSGPALLGTGEDSYFSQMQQLTAYYSSWADIGAAMSSLGGYLAIVLSDPSPPASAKTARNLCAPGTAAAASWNALTCGGVLYITQTQARNKASAWKLTGASWSQASDGLLATAIEPAANGYFTSGDTVWVRDIATYGLPANKAQGAKPLADSTSDASEISSAPASSVGTASVYSGSTLKSAPTIGLKSTKWNLNPNSAGTALEFDFVPASSSQWDNLLNVDEVPPYPGASADQIGQPDVCLPATSGASVNNCTSANSVGELMTAAGMLNGGQPPASLIFFTGETSSWQVQNGPLWWATKTTGLKDFPDGWTFPDAMVASFVDTQSLPNNGFSAVMNPPNTAVGDFTPNSLAPFLSSTLTEDDYNVGTAYSYLTLTQSSTSGSSQRFNETDPPPPWDVGFYTAPACAGGGDVPPASAPFSLGQAFSGSYNLDCDGLEQITPTVQNWSGVARTASTAFYSPFTATVGYGTAGWNYCGNQSNECPANPLFNQGGYPGWFLDGGYWPANGSATNTQLANPTPQTQYMWPVMDANQCSLMPIAQGSTGQIGAPAACANMTQDYLSSRYGVDFGAVVVSLDPGTSGGFLTVELNNSSSSAVKGALSVSTSGVSLGSSLEVSNGTASGTLTVSNCAPRKSATVCNVLVPPGQSYVSIPLSSPSSSASASALFISGANTSSDTMSFVKGTPPSITTAPGPVQNLSAVYDATDTSSRPVLKWDSPLLSFVGGVDGYRISASLPGQDPVRVSVPLSNVALSDQGKVSSLVLPASVTPKLGTWTVSIVAYNTYGAGDPRSVDIRYGASTPDSVPNLTAVELYDGRVRLAWGEPTSSPPVTSYIVQAKNPSGKALTPITTTDTSYVTADSLDTGPWTVSVVAVNSLGKSEPAIATVDVTGTIPDVPSQVASTFNNLGQLSVSWHSPTTSVVNPDSYSVAVFAPFTPSDPSTAQPLVQMEVPVSGSQSIVSVPALLQLGRNWPVGPYTVMVSASNKHGVGPAQASTVMVTDLLLKTMAAEVALAKADIASAVLLQDLEYYACSKGFSSLRFQTGTCFTDGNWIPAAGFLPAALQAQPGSLTAPTVTEAVSLTQTSFKGGANPATAMLNPDGTVTITSVVKDPWPNTTSIDYWWAGQRNIAPASTDNAGQVVSSWTTPVLTVGTPYRFYTSSGSWDTYFTVTVNTTTSDTPGALPWQRPTPAQEANPGASAVSASGGFPVTGSVSGSTVTLNVTYTDRIPGRVNLQENGDFLWGSAPTSYSSGEQFTIVLPNQSVGVHTYKMYSANILTTITVRV